MKHFFSLTALAFLLTSLSPTHAAVSSGSLIKSSTNSAVYYLVDGKRYAFPNEKVFFSWYNDFSTVTTVPATELASYQLAGNVTYHPGRWLVKIQTDPKVYAVSRYGILRWITSEQLAVTLYGTDWNKKVHDVPDSFFINYQSGSPINASTDYNVSAELAVTQIAQNILGIIAIIPEPNSVASIAGCQIFPGDNPWNQNISGLPLHPKSATYINSIGLSVHLHPDFGEDQSYGIPYNVVPGTQLNVPITYTAYGAESDPGPFPIPSNAKIESGSDAHVLVLDRDACRLYELFAASKNSNDNGWSAQSGATWDLHSNAVRPDTWTSADAAGLPILPGLVRYDEVAAGVIKHAIRFTASHTQNAHIFPARHDAGSSNLSYPPMGLRVRMKANYDLSHLTGQARVIATAMKTYGMILADNGSNWFVNGATDPRWNDDELNQLKNIPGSAFEAVDTTINTNPPPTVPYASMETKVFNLINQYRQSKGLSTLIWNDTVASVSRDHSDNMANGKVAFGHDEFSARMDTLDAQVGLTAMAENVAYNNGYADPATAAVNGWLKSPGHLANIETAAYTHTGIGIVRNTQNNYYFTQIFITH